MIAIGEKSVPSMHKSETAAQSQFSEEGMTGGFELPSNGGVVLQSDFGNLDGLPFSTADAKNPDGGDENDVQGCP